MEGVSQYGGWLRFWTGNEQLSRQSELISRSEGRRRKRGRGRGEGRKLVHESVVARDRGVVVVVVVVHERDPWNDRDWNAVRAHLSIRNKIGDLAMAKIERAYKIDLRKKGFKRFSRVPGEKSPPGIVPLSSPPPSLSPSTIHAHLLCRPRGIRPSMINPSSGRILCWQQISRHGALVFHRANVQRRTHFASWNTSRANVRIVKKPEFLVRAIVVQGGTPVCF